MEPKQLWTKRRDRSPPKTGGRAWPLEEMPRGNGQLQTAGEECLEPQPSAHPLLDEAAPGSEVQKSSETLCW